MSDFGIVGAVAFSSAYVFWRTTMQLRLAVAEGTNTEPPKLQQLWIEQGSGRQEWRNVPSVVVTRSEFNAA